MGPTARLALAAILIASSAPPAAGRATSALEHLRTAAANPNTRDALVREGREASFFCANCHGDTGTSRFPGVPNLASQNAAYLVGQIEAFLAGRRRNEFMRGLMKVLAERDKAAIALYYATSPAKPSGPPGPHAGAGRERYQRYCASCHGDGARGSEAFPRLAGQQREYLRVSLQRYLDRSGERTSADMSAAVGQLGREHIGAVVDYLATLD